MTDRDPDRDPDRAAVLAAHPDTAVYQGGNPPRAKYAVVRSWPRADRDRLSLLGAWCRSPAAAWRSAARRLREGRPGPGGCGNRA